LDSEKFDKVVLDLLYDELDELTRASAIRHVEQSGHAKALYSELKATRAVGSLPLVEPPPELEERILAAAAAARKQRSVGQRLGGFVSLAASYAMRPQLAMAALLMLMVGSSLLLLRAKPGETSAVQVTERGVPESDKEATAVVPVPEPLAPAPPEGALASRAGARARTERDDAPADKARAAEEQLDRKDENAMGGADELAEKRAAPTRAFAPPPDTMQLSDGMGESVHGATAGGSAPPGAGGPPSGGCADDLSHYEDVARTDPSPAAANAARWAAAGCYVALGRIGRARSAYTSLLGAPGYAERAREALAALPPEAVAQAAASAAPPAAAPAAKAKASTAPASPPAAEPSQP